MGARLRPGREWLVTREPGGQYHRGFDGLTQQFAWREWPNRQAGTACRSQLLHWLKKAPL